MPVRPRPLDHDVPLVIAHRGWSARAPENTLAAFALAADAGFAIELDTSLSADGVPIVLHDDTVDRTTSGRGRVDQLDAAALTALPAGLWHDPPVPDARVPTLADVLALVDGRVPVDVEIKPARRGDRWSATARADAVAAVIAARPRGVFVTSFDPFVLGRLRTVLPDVRRGQLFSTFEGTDLSTPARVVLRNLWLNRVSRPDVLVADQALLGPGAVARLKRQGLPVYAWTVNDPARAAALVADGVDAVITDVPERIAAALAR